MHRHVRSAAAALLVALGGAGCAWVVEAAEVRDVGERIFPFEPGGEISIESQNGRIVVEAWDKPQVRVQITRTARAGNDERARALLKDLRADVEVAPDRVRIRSRYPKLQENVGIWDLLGARIGALHIHYYLQVPKEISLSLETSNGEIRIRGVHGSVKAATVNGAVEAAGAGGSFELNTTNGELRLAGIAGSVVGRTTNGGIAAHLTSVPPRGAVDLATTNGNVEVVLPNDVSARIEARTTNGRVRVRGFDLAPRGVTTSKSVQGTIGGGGARVALETTNGTVEVIATGSRRKR